MMMQGLSPRLSRALAVSLLVATAGGMWSFAIDPMIGAFQGTQAHIDEVADRLERFRRLGHNRAELERMAAEQRRTWEDSGILLTAETPVLAAANLQKSVKDIAGRHQIALRSVQPLAPSPEGQVVKIGVRVRLETDAESFQKLLYELESASPYLFLDQVDIRAMLTGAQQRAPVRLDVQADIVGYMRSTAK